MRMLPMVLAGLVLGCGDGSDDHGRTPAQGNPQNLADALERLRLGLAMVCQTTDGCYPEVVKEDSCNVGSAADFFGFERAWPPMAADECWQPLFEKNESALLGDFDCVREANDALERC